MSGQVGTKRRHSRGVGLALGILALAGPAMAFEARDHAEAYRTCPAGGVAFWMRTPRVISAPTAGASRIVLEDDFGVDVRWAGEPGWIDPQPVPDDILNAGATWVRPASMLSRHEGLRRSSGYPLPDGEPRILLIERTEHWAWRWDSTAAVRGPDGLWRIDHLLAYDDGTSERGAGTLAEADSRRLDDLLADPCLEREPFQSAFAHITSSDNVAWTLEVEAEAGPLRIAGRDSGFGRAGAIKYLLSKARSE